MTPLVKCNIIETLNLRELEFIGRKYMWTSYTAIVSRWVRNLATSIVLGGFGIGLFVRWVERSFQLIRFNLKGSAAKPREPISPFSFFRFHLSARTFRRQQNGQVSTAIQSVGVSVRLFGFLFDETPGANPDNPIYYSMGFAQGVSSSLTVNAFRFGCDWCCRDVPGERGLSKRFEVFSRQAHVMIARKAPRFAVRRHGALVTWRPNWRFPKDSLAHSVLIRFTQGYSRYVKSLSASPIKGDGSVLIKGITFWEIYCWKRVLGFPLVCVLVLVLELRLLFIVCAR
jgi:hypothetical protein